MKYLADVFRMILLLSAGVAVAQTQTSVVTTGATAGTVPVFGSTSETTTAVTNSPFTYLGGNTGIGLGTEIPESYVTVGGDTTNYGYVASGSWPFTTAIIGGSSSDGIFFGEYRVRHAGINWNGTTLDFIDASDWGSNSDQWIGYASAPLSINIATGNIGIGTTNPSAKLQVSGNLKLSSGSSASMTYADGTQQTTAWTGVLCGGDYAEDRNAAGGKASYEPGDVLVLTSGEKGDVKKSAEAYSTLVAGICATKPGVIGRRESVAKLTDNIPMAMIGVVPTKVSTENGPIHRDDLLVTSSVAGYAMRGTDREKMFGAVIGKAMGTIDSGAGVIEVLVTLQ